MWCCHVLETRSDMDGIQGIIGRRGSEVRRAAATGECSTGGGGGRGVGAAALVTVGGAPPGGWLLGPAPVKLALRSGRARARSAGGCAYFHSRSSKRKFRFRT